MKTVTKILAAVMLLGSTLSCRKDIDPSNGTFIRFTQNGKKIEYKYPSGETDGPNSGFYWCLIGAEGDNAQEQFGISVMDTKPVHTGQYASNADGDLVVLAMSDSNGIYWGSNLSGNPNVVVKITEMTETSIKGQFSGKLFNEDDQTRVIQIVDGEFSALRVGKTK